MAWGRGGGRGGSPTAEMPCPDCGGPMWDNRSDKKGATSPDFRCKNKQGCGGKVWLDGDSGGAPAGPAQAGGRALPSLAAAQYRCTEHAIKVLPQLFKSKGLAEPSVAEILNYATTLFIAHQQNPGRDIFPNQAKAAEPAPKPAPPPPPPKPVAPPAPPARDPMDDNLPF